MTAHKCPTDLEDSFSRLPRFPRFPLLFWLNENVDIKRQTLQDINTVERITLCLKEIVWKTPTNPELCVTLLQQNTHLLHVNCAFASVASLEF